MIIRTEFTGRVTVSNSWLEKKTFAFPYKSSVNSLQLKLTKHLMKRHMTRTRVEI